MILIYILFNFTALVVVLYYNWLFFLWIFAHGTTEYKQLVNFHETNENHLSGPSSISIAQFTVKVDESGYGYIAATGNICIMSGTVILHWNALFKQESGMTVGICTMLPQQLSI